MASFLGTTPFDRATAYAEARAADTIQNTLVDVLIPVDVDDEAFRDTLGSLGAQTAAKLEIIAVDTSLDGLLFNARPGEQFRVVRAPGATFLEAIQKGLSHCFGDYISILRPGTLLNSSRTRKQVSAMQLEGNPISYTLYSLFDGRGSINKQCRWIAFRTLSRSGHMAKSSFHLETAMIHSAELLGGLDLSFKSDDELFISLTERGQPLLIDEPLVSIPSSTSK